MDALKKSSNLGAAPARDAHTIGGFFLMNGFNHFAQLNVMAGYAKSKSVPAPALAVGGSGVLLFLGGLRLLLGHHPTIGVGLLVIFLLSVPSGIHNFWTVQDP